MANYLILVPLIKFLLKHGLKEKYVNKMSTRALVLCIIFISIITIFTMVLMPSITAGVAPLCYVLLFKTGHLTTINLPPLNSSLVEVQLTDSDYFIYRQMPDGSKYACVGKRDMSINSPPCLQFGGYQTICTPHDHPFCLPASTGRNYPELGLTIYDEQQGGANYYIISDSGVSDPIALSPNTSITLDSVWFDQMQCSLLLSISLAFVVFGVFCWLLGVVTACLFWRCYKRQARTERGDNEQTPLLADHHPLRGINAEKLFTKPKFWIPCGWLILMNGCTCIFLIALMPIVTAVVAPLCYDLLFKTGHATTINLPPLNSSRVEVKLTDSLYFIYQNRSQGKYMCVGGQHLSVASPPCFHLNYYQSICTPKDHPLCLAASTDKHSAAGASIFDELTNRTTYYILYEGSDTPYSEVLSGSRSLDSIWYGSQGCPYLFGSTIAMFLCAIWVAIGVPIGYIWGLRKNRRCCWREKGEHIGRNTPRPQSRSREHLDIQNPESNGQIGQVDGTEQTALLIESSSSSGDSYASIQPDSDDQAMMISPILPSIMIAPKDIHIPALSLPVLRQEVLPIAADKWDAFGVFLGVQPPVIRTVSTEHPTTDFKAACEEMLMRWLAYDDGTGDRPREWSTVIDALEKTGFGEEAEELRQKL